MASICKIFGHKFQPRFDITPTGMPRLEGTNAAGAARIIEALSVKTYIHDVCVRCGRTVQRGGK